MAVPKQKTSKSRRDIRRSHLALTINHAIEECANCRELKLRHRACMNCGLFKGTLIKNFRKGAQKPNSAEPPTTSA